MPVPAKHLTTIAIIVLVWLIGARSSNAQTPATETQLQSLGDVWLEGTVGSAAVRVYIGDAGWPKSSGLWGMYYYTRYWSPLPLDGDWSGPGQIRLTEGEPGASAAQARFDLNVSARQSVDGTWTSADGRRVVPVKLRRVPKPPRFEIAIRRARLFSDPKWPITLRYPAGWRLDVTDTTLALRSPDPEDMIFNNELRCVRGSGVLAPPNTAASPIEFEWPFFRGATGWLVATDLAGECDTAACQPAQSRRIGNAEFMTATAGYRGHFPWGYMGLAEASFHFVVIGDEWAHCSDRVLDDATRIGVADRKREPRQ